MVKLRRLLFTQLQWRHLPQQMIMEHQEKPGEPMSGSIPTDAPAPILKDVTSPSPDGGSER